MVGDSQKWYPGEFANHYRGEDPVGDWRVIVRDVNDNGKKGKLIDWQINLWGEIIDESQAKLHPLPGDKNENQNPQISAPASTVPLGEPTKKPSVSSSPDDQPVRPVKPTATSDLGSQPATDPNEDDKGAGSKDRPAIIPGFFPTFGQSGKSQAWIYGAIVVILLFVTGLGIFLCIQRRKRTGGVTGYKEVDDYEFEDLDSPVEGQAPKGKGRKTRDLYDAFGASDDDGDMFSDSDEENEKRYRDEDGSVGGSSGGGSSGGNEKRT